MSQRLLSWPSHSGPPAAENIFFSQVCMVGLPLKNQNQRAGRGAEIRVQPFREVTRWLGKVKPAPS